MFNATHWLEARSASPDQAFGKEHTAVPMRRGGSTDFNFVARNSRSNKGPEERHYSKRARDGSRQGQFCAKTLGGKKCGHEQNGVVESIKRRGDVIRQPCFDTKATTETLPSHKLVPVANPPPWD